jgi:hypothetical protein
VKWNDFLQILRVRAIEEADARDDAWDAATLRAITLDAKDAAARAADLIAKSRVPDLVEALRVPVMPGWITASGAAAAFTGGWWFAALGQEREINLLALPLIAILLWNAVVLLLSVWHGAEKEANRGRTPPWLEKLLDRYSAPGASAGAVKSSPAIRARFRALAWPPLLRRTGFRCRAWLHLGAALFAFGSVAGMYARGWSTEYRAVWESTLLGENGARAFFGALFAPASKAAGITIPLDEIPGMRRGASSPALKPGAALPWIHLYSATLALFVMVPRVLFALLELSRANRVPALELRGANWLDYLAGVRASAEGDGATVEIIAHALPLDDASRERWRRLARTRWRDAGGVNCRAIAPGAETDFVSSWTPAAPRILLVFNLATTPETEVHRALAEGVRTRLREASPGGVLTMALDDTELKKRWSGFADSAAKLEARTDSWREAMRGFVADWI